MGQIIEFSRYHKKEQTLAEKLRFCVDKVNIDYSLALLSIIQYVNENQRFDGIDKLMSSIKAFSMMEPEVSEQYRQYFTRIEKELSGINSLIRGRAPTSEFDWFIVDNCRLGSV